MAVSAHTTHICPRLSSSVTRFTTDQVLAALGDRPDQKRNGTLRAIVLRGIPKAMVARSALVIA